MHKQRNTRIDKQQNTQMIVVAAVFALVMLAIVEAVIFTCMKNKLGRNVVAALVPLVVIILCIVGWVFLKHINEQKLPDQQSKSKLKSSHSHSHNSEGSYKQKTKTKNAYVKRAPGCIKGYSSNWQRTNNASRDSTRGKNDTNKTLSASDVFLNEIKHGEIERYTMDDLRMLVEKNINFINSKDSGGNTALYSAARINNQELVQLLLKKGADPNLESDQEGLPLHAAAYAGNVSMVSLLLKCGGIDNTLNRQDYNGRTPLHNAVHNGNIELVKMLIEYGADINLKDKMLLRLPLHKASERIRDEGVVKLLIDPAMINDKDYLGYTALHIAAESGNIGVARLLCESGIDVNSKDFFGKTALIRAIKNNKEDVVKFLLSVEDINVKSVNTALSVARSDGRINIVKLLLAHKDSNVSSEGSISCAKLSLVAGSGNVEVTKWLLSTGISVNSQVEGSCTTLVHAVTSGKDDVVEFLFAN